MATDGETSRPEAPRELEQRYRAIVEAREGILHELEQMGEAKKRYESAVETFLDELEKDPTKYKRRFLKGKKTTVEDLTTAHVRTIRKAFMRSTVERDAPQFFCDWDDCDCPERSWCVRLNCDPGPFNTCCYLCLSPDVIQCEGDFP